MKTEKHLFVTEILVEATFTEGSNEVFIIPKEGAIVPLIKNGSVNKEDFLKQSRDAKSLDDGK
jgi:hypothetical protein